MYNFDFDKIIDRRGMDALAVDGLGTAPGFAPEPPEDGFDIIPMWVADMNFEGPSSITDAISKRLEHRLFGYFRTSDAYYEAIIGWQAKRNGVTGLKPEHIGYENGVLGGLVSVLNAYLEPGDKVLLHNPTYVGFTGSITNAGYKIVHSDLILGDDDVWRMDYEDMDRKIKENGIKVCIFCNPHNPCGRAWTCEEMAKAAEVYEKNGCIVISDEIWSDLLLNGNKYTPFQSVNEFTHNNTVALYAPSKTFNLAGLIGSYHIIYNDEIREKVEEAGSKSHYNNMNVLSMHALIGAYSEEGMAWLDELRGVLSKNINYACDEFARLDCGIKAVRPEGTYMLFLDCSGWCRAKGRTIEDLLKSGWRVGVAWQDGRPFRNGDYIRLNLALPHSRVEEAFSRLKYYVL